MYRGMEACRCMEALRHVDVLRYEDEVYLGSLFILLPHHLIDLCLLGQEILLLLLLL